MKHYDFLSSPGQNSCVWISICLVLLRPCQLWINIFVSILFGVLQQLYSTLATQWASFPSLLLSKISTYRPQFLRFYCQIKVHFLAIILTLSSAYIDMISIFTSWDYHIKVLFPTLHLLHKVITSQVHKSVNTADNIQYTYCM